ncbi:MAG: hypothetical protein NTY03_02305 [Candidatus Bathyarchaeota archaeon]|nr:hypothetical protein [Candidatus Bathyarchaeota archaeon]
MATLLIATTGICIYYQYNTQDANPKDAVVKEALRVCTQDLLLGYRSTLIILSNDQIKDVEMPTDLAEVKLLVLSKEAIDAKAAVDGPFLYLVFKEVNVYDNTAFVSFYLTGVFDSGAGGSINLTLENGVWVGEGGFYWIA